MKLAPLWGDNKHKTCGHSLQDDLPTESRPFPTACNLRIMIEKRPGPCNGRRIPRVRGGRLMLHFARWMMVPAVVLGWLVAAGPASASSADRSPVVSGIHDEAGFFKPETVTTAKKRVEQIAAEYHWSVYVETFKEIPAGKKGDYKPENRKKFFRE